MKRQLNHSRYLDYGARDIADRSYHRAKTTPTAKQIKFYKKLYALCKENGIDPKTSEYTRTRIEYAMAIDTLIDRLRDHGIDIAGNGKKGTYILTHGSDRHGRYYTDEIIKVTD